MGSSTRHWAIAARSKAVYYGSQTCPPYAASSYNAASVRPTLADRVVHLLLRVATLIGGAERVESWALANLGDVSPLGEPVETYPLVALLREGRLQDLGRRD